MIFDDLSVDICLIHMRKEIYIAISLLVIGSLVYFLFRQDVVFLSWISRDVLSVFHISVDTNDNIFIYMLLYCLPDALWYMALLIFQVSFVQYGRINKLLFRVSVILPFVGEILQLFHYIPGTYDFFDVVVYVITLLLFILCRKLLYKYC